MNTTEVAVPQPWRDLMQERKDRITALEQKNAKLVAALKNIAELTIRRQLPLTMEINDIACAALREIGEL